METKKAFNEIYYVFENEDDTVTIMNSKGCETTWDSWEDFILEAESEGGSEFLEWDY